MIIAIHHAIVGALKGDGSFWGPFFRTFWIVETGIVSGLIFTRWRHVRRPFKNPKRRQDPFLAWKLVTIQGPGYAYLLKMGSNLFSLKTTGEFLIRGSVGPYKPDATAQCVNGTEHRGGTVPSWNCTCGFWALKKPIELSKTHGRGGNALARVELFGKVIEGRLGYRASRQRVLSITYDWQCVFNSCEKMAEVFVSSDIDAVLPHCLTHASSLGRSSAVFQILTPAELSAKVGTEVHIGAKDNNTRVNS